MSAAGTVAGGRLGLGYVRMPEGPAPQVLADGIKVMEAFAAAQGYGLGEVFVDDDPLRHLAWGQLLDAVRAVRPVAVLVPDVLWLRPTAQELAVMRARLAYVTSSPLISARPLAAAVEVTAALRLDAVRPAPRPGHTGRLAGRARRLRALWRPSWGRRASPGRGCQ